MLASLLNFNFHANLKPSLQSHPSRLFREERREHHAQASVLGASIIDVAMLSEITVRLYGVGDAVGGVYIR